MIFYDPVFKNALKNFLFQVKFLLITKESLYKNWIKNRIDHMTAVLNACMHEPPKLDFSHKSAHLKHIPFNFNWITTTSIFY